jgi:tagaturonate reductase
MSGRIMQFGTSRFLQGHADLFVDQARENGQNIGPITIVKTTAGGSRDGRVTAFNSGAGFPVRLRGYDNGTLVDKTIKVKSVTAALDANLHWSEVLDTFVQRTDIVISNVGDSGLDLAPADAFEAPQAGVVPASFPAKLLVLLKNRFEQGAKPLLILPCELLASNGLALRQSLTDLSTRWSLSHQFHEWLGHSVTICNTLVDRIVSEAIEPIGAIAEPYGLWAIEWHDGTRFPFEHRNVIYTEDLEPFLRLKLHILNLGHSFLAEIWKTEGRPAEETVQEILKDFSVKSRLLRLFDTEIIPGFETHKMAGRAFSYVATTMQRFENPFLDHRISDIYQNHAVKIERRMKAFVSWTGKTDPGARFPQLMEICSKHLSFAAG